MSKLDEIISCEGLSAEMVNVLNNMTKKAKDFDIYNFDHATVDIGAVFLEMQAFLLHWYVQYRCWYELISKCNPLTSDTVVEIELFIQKYNKFLADKFAAFETTLKGGVANEKNPS